jgi:hypothetical protein
MKPAMISKTLDVPTYLVTPNDSTQRDVQPSHSAPIGIVAGVCPTSARWQLVTVFSTRSRLPIEFFGW